MTALDGLGRGGSPPRVPAETLRATYWKAAREGLSGDTLRRLSALVDHLRPALDRLGEYRHVSDEVQRLAHEGNGAARQIAAWRRRREIADVIAEAAAATLR
jgi:carboxylate-amine ligase